MWKNIAWQPSGHKLVRYVVISFAAGRLTNFATKLYVMLRIGLYIILVYAYAIKMMNKTETNRQIWYLNIDRYDAFLHLQNFLLWAVAVIEEFISNWILNQKNNRYFHTPT